MLWGPSLSHIVSTYHPFKPATTMADLWHLCYADWFMMFNKEAGIFMHLV